jgi:hypothetical protein
LAEMISSHVLRVCLRAVSFSVPERTRLNCLLQG